MSTTERFYLGTSARHIYLPLPVFKYGQQAEQTTVQKVYDRLAPEHHPGLLQRPDADQPSPSSPSREQQSHSSCSSCANRAVEMAGLREYRLGVYSNEPFDEGNRSVALCDSTSSAEAAEVAHRARVKRKMDRL